MSHQIFSPPHTGGSAISPVDPHSCALLGPVALFVQSMMLVFVLVSLVIKRQYERSKRTWKVWICDISKQLVGQGLVHASNLLISAQVSRGQTNPCSLYFLNVLIDTTLGVLILYFSLLTLTKLSKLYILPKLSPSTRISLISGEYGHPTRPNARSFFAQTGIYLLALVVMKLVVLLLFAIMLDHVLLPIANWTLGWMFEWTQVVFVMAVFPLGMNVLQFCLIDSLIKAKHPTTPSSKPEGSGIDNDSESLLDDDDNDGLGSDSGEGPLLPKHHDSNFPREDENEDGDVDFRTTTDTNTQAPTTLLASPYLPSGPSTSSAIALEGTERSRPTAHRQRSFSRISISDNSITNPNSNNNSNTNLITSTNNNTTTNINVKPGIGSGINNDLSPIPSSPLLSPEQLKRTTSRKGSTGYGSTEVSPSFGPVRNGSLTALTGGVEEEDWEGILGSHLDSRERGFRLGDEEEEHDDVDDRGEGSRNRDRDRDELEQVQRERARILNLTIPGNDSPISTPISPSIITTPTQASTLSLNTPRRPPSSNRRRISDDDRRSARRSLSSDGGLMDDDLEGGGSTPTGGGSGLRGRIESLGKSKGMRVVDESLGMRER